MERRHYVPMGRHHDISIRRFDDVPLRRLCDIPLRHHWVFHLRFVWDVVKTYHWDVLATFHWDVVGCFIWDVPATSLGRIERPRYDVATTSCCRVGSYILTYCFPLTRLFSSILFTFLSFSVPVFVFSLSNVSCSSNSFQNPFFFRYC